MRIIRLIKTLNNKRREKRVKKIFGILREKAVQTQQFKAPLIPYMNFEEVAKVIDREIK